MYSGMEKKNIQKYRGVRPAELVSVIEGDGAEYPYQEVTYVLSCTEINGLVRSITIGKIVPLTEEEKSWFKNY